MIIFELDFVVVLVVVVDVVEVDVVVEVVVVEVVVEVVVVVVVVVEVVGIDLDVVPRGDFDLSTVDKMFILASFVPYASPIAAPEIICSRQTFSKKIAILHYEL